jgi:hypothetical protein
VAPSPENHVTFPVMIVDFFWCEDQECIGAVLQNRSISFWHGKTNFAKEVVITTQKICTRIWHVRHIDEGYEEKKQGEKGARQPRSAGHGSWFTLNKKQQIEHWDIANSRLKSTLNRGLPAMKVAEMIEMEKNKTLAVSTLGYKDKVKHVKARITILDLVENSKNSKI